MEEFNDSYNSQPEVPLPMAKKKSVATLYFKVLLNTFIAQRKTMTSLLHEY